MKKTLPTSKPIPNTTYQAKSKRKTTPWFYFSLPEKNTLTSHNPDNEHKEQNQHFYFIIILVLTKFFK
jgi:hypothetical protein